MNDITRLLESIEQGDAHAADQLLPLVYDRLRELAASNIAKERPGQTLQATALVHEAYLRLAGRAPDRHWDNRGHFFAAAAEAMRRILVEKARRKRGPKQGGGLARLDLDPEGVPLDEGIDPIETLAVHEALDQLAIKAPRKAELVKLRYFLGCTMAEAAAILGIGQTSAEEDWTYARAWLRRQWLGGDKELGANPKNPPG